MTWNWVGRYEEVYNMCEKNLEGKVLSPPSNDDTDEASNNDIEEETIIDDSIDDEIEEEIIKPKKRSYKKKKKKTTIKIQYKKQEKSSMEKMSGSAEPDMALRWAIICPNDSKKCMASSPICT